MDNEKDFLCKEINYIEKARRSEMLDTIYDNLIGKFRSRLKLLLDYSPEISKENIVALVPCRLDSQRIKKKNTRDFAGESLLKIKLNQLLKVPEISKIIVSTNDPEVIRISKGIDTNKIEIEHREEYYASSECTNDEFIKYFADKLDIKGHILFTPVTSPFITEETYSKAIQTYLKNLDKNDSLLSVKKIKGYIWDEEKNPVTYNVKEQGRWAKTQTINPVYYINSGIFLIDFSLMKDIGDRVGKTPHYFETNEIENLDIDYPEDFNLAEKLWKSLMNGDKYCLNNDTDVLTDETEEQDV